MKEVKIVLAHRTSEDFMSYEKVKLSDWKPGTGEHLLSHAFVMDLFRKLMGKTLTVVDASISGSQNKAVKDLIRNIYSEEFGFLADWSFDQIKLQELIPEDIDEKTLGTVSIENVLGVEEK